MRQTGIGREPRQSPVIIKHKQIVCTDSENNEYRQNVKETEILEVNDTRVNDVCP